MASEGEPLNEFFKRYEPPLCPNKHTCVGLGIEVVECLKVLDKDFPGLKNALMIVSCEESIEDLMYHTASGFGPQDRVTEAEKDHVLVACRIRIDGRSGVFLSDLGYHIARIVTVMMDKRYPHTGWFVQVDEPYRRKEYMYRFNGDNCNFVEWHEVDNKPNGVEHRLALVYVAKAYLSAVSVTEKRNLVWTSKSLLVRNAEGNPTAGICITTKKQEEKILIIYTRSQVKRRKKFAPDTFLATKPLSNAVLRDVRRCNKQLCFADGELLAMLQKISTIMSDEVYMAELLSLNQKLIEIPAGVNN